MTPEQQALLQSVIDSPDDDAPRLVYADWLEEYGTDNDRLHAELIRVQIKLAGPKTGVFGRQIDVIREADVLGRMRKAGIITAESNLGLTQDSWERRSFAMHLDRGYLALTTADADEWFWPPGVTLYRSAPIRVVRLRRFEVRHLVQASKFPWRKTTSLEVDGELLCEYHADRLTGTVGMRNLHGFTAAFDDSEAMMAFAVAMPGVNIRSSNGINPGFGLEED